MQFIQIHHFWIVLASWYVIGVVEGKVGVKCTIKDWRRSPGVCKPLKDCKEAISDLRAGVLPTLCPARQTLACCPVEKRVSEEMCEAYLEILREDHGPTPLLPLDFLQNRSKKIHCVNYVSQLIVDGSDAQQDQFPFMVALAWGQNTSDLEFGCGGTLISENFVLTAAHCIARSPEPSYALLGDTRLRPEYRGGSGRRVLVKIVQHILHPQYRKPLTYNDIALVRLERSVTLSRSVLPACLPQPRMRNELKNNTIATGWGRTGTADEQSNVLQAVNLARLAHTECSLQYNSGDLPDRQLKYPHGLARSQFCAGDANRENSKKDTCKGDSGGPLLVSGDQHKCIYYVVGITSFGPSVCGLLPGVYTSVQSHLDFIEKNVWPD